MPRYRNTGPTELICHDPTTGRVVGIGPGAEADCPFEVSSPDLKEVHATPRAPAKGEPATIADEQASA